MQPFVQQPVPGVRWRDLIRNQPNLAAAEAHLINRFATAERIQAVRPLHINEIGVAYGIKPRVDLAPAMRELFARYLTYCITDAHLSDDEVDDLVYLRDLFDLSNADARAVHDREASRHYRAAAEERLVDHELDDDDREFLEQLRSRLLLSSRAAEQATRDAAAITVGLEAERLTRDGGLSPGDADQLAALAQRLGITWSADASGPERIAQMRRLRTLERAELPIVTAELPLAPSEVAHLTVSGAQLWEVPRPNIAEREAGTVQFVVDFVQWAIEELSEPGIPKEPTRAREPTMQDVGLLVVTNQQLRFTGRQHERAIPLREIRDLGGGDGTLTLRQHGRPRPITFRGPITLADALLLLRRLTPAANQLPPH